jgi:ATP-dependent Lon protease
MAARSYLWAHAEEIGIAKGLIKNNGIHLHVPAGAIPKDGPSAGVTMSVALASVFTGRKVRNDTAMTGEITLSGLVFPVGGIKEKVLAAHRAGIKRIILPKSNESAIEEIPEEVRSDLEFVLAERITDAIEAALEKEPSEPVGGQFETKESEPATSDLGDQLVAKED